MFSPSAAVPIRATPSEQMPAYEVATIKPWDGKGFATPLRFYIDQAFGIPPNITARVVGPDWISNTRFVITSKPPDAIRDAMQTMTPAERSRQNGLMMQSLLADRFQFKAHFEMRELPVYELVVAKGGSKLVENSDPTKGRFGVGGSMVRAAAVKLQVLIGVLECNPDIGGREVVDKTGLTGTYDISLKWAPLQTAPAAGGESASAPSPDEGASLFTSIEEQLGLKLVPAKAPSEVLVIDRIEQPTPN
jgi:bla regulator protein blaR1